MRDWRVQNNENSKSNENRICKEEPPPQTEFGTERQYPDGWHTEYSGRDSNV